MKYDYRKALFEDISNYIQSEGIKPSDYDSVDDMREALYDDLWTVDSVTGNGSGSYTFNRYKAGQYLQDNSDLALEACNEFCVPADNFMKRWVDGDWEYFDVTIRCYLLGEVLDRVINAMME